MIAYILKGTGIFLKSHVANIWVCQDAKFYRHLLKTLKIIYFTSRCGILSKPFVYISSVVWKVEDYIIIIFFSSNKFLLFFLWLLVFKSLIIRTAFVLL